MSNEFKSALLVERDMTKEHRWVLKAPLIYKTGDTCIIVQKDFDFDFEETKEELIEKLQDIKVKLMKIKDKETSDENNKG